MFVGKKTALRAVMAAVLVVSACSKNKDIPTGTRISVLDQTPSYVGRNKDAKISVNVPAALDSDRWLQTGANAQHSLANLKVGTDFKRQWKADFGKGGSKREFLVSQPLVSGKAVYTIDANAVVRAFKIEDGETLWAVDLESQNKYEDATALKGIGIACDGTYIYAVTGYGSVFALQAKDGKIIWQKDLETPLRIAPVLAAGKVFVQSADNKFWALDQKNGEILWDYDIAMESTTMVGGAPAAYSPSLDMAVTGFSNGEIQAFNASIGAPLWSDSLVSNRQAYSSTFLHTIKAAPVIEGETVYALGSSDVLTAIDLRTGERRWEKTIGGTQAPLSVGNVLYVVDNQNRLSAVAKNNGDILWREPIEVEGKPTKAIAFSPLMLNGQLIVALSDGNLLSYDPLTGKLQKTVDLGEKFNAAPIVAQGYVFFITSNAKLIAYK